MLNIAYKVGGGLIRSAGGWSEVKALGCIGDRQASDERILGGGKFVNEVTRQVELGRKYRLLASDRPEKTRELIVKISALYQERFDYTHFLQYFV